MPGLGQGGRHAVPFASFFACADGATPASLLKAGIYDQLAVPLKGGPWRAAGLALLRKALLAAADDEPTPPSAAAPPLQGQPQGRGWRTARTARAIVRLHGGEGDVAPLEAPVADMRARRASMRV